MVNLLAICQTFIKRCSEPVLEKVIYLNRDFLHRLVMDKDANRFEGFPVILFAKQQIDSGRIPFVYDQSRFFEKRMFLDI